MSLLDKMGVYYLYDPKRSLIIEVILGNGLIALYKCAYFIVPYIVLMLGANYFIRKEIAGDRKLAVLNLLLSLILLIVFWFIFDNGLKDILNPLLSTSLAGLSIYLIVSLKKQDQILNFPPTP